MTFDEFLAEQMEDPVFCFWYEFWGGAEMENEPNEIVWAFKDTGVVEIDEGQIYDRAYRAIGKWFVDRHPPRITEVDGGKEYVFAVPVFE